MTEEMQRHVFERLVELGWRAKLKGTEYLSYILAWLLMRDAWPLPANKVMMEELEEAYGLGHNCASRQINLACEEWQSECFRNVFYQDEFREIMHREPGNIRGGCREYIVNLYIYLGNLSAADGGTSP